MNELNIGQVIEGIYPLRDAIHIPVVQVICDEDHLDAGQRIALRAGTDLAYKEEYRSTGVVDPYLDGSLMRGDKFWMFLFPGTVTGMVHQWKHPEFTHLEASSPAEQWLRDFAERWAMDFNELVTEAGGQGGNRWVTAHGHDLHKAEEIEDIDDMYYHLEQYLGRRISPKQRREMNWSCSC